MSRQMKQFVIPPVTIVGRGHFYKEVEPTVWSRVAYWQVSDRVEHIDLGRKVYLLLLSVSLLQDPLE